MGNNNSSKSTKRAMLSSVVAMILCVSMLIGTTFAWFTDSASSKINKITAGTLKVTLEHETAGAWEDVTDKKLFDNVQLWEPGVLTYENLRVGNAGNLALKYQLAVNFANATKVAGTDKSLLDVIKIAVIPGGVTTQDRDSILNAIPVEDWMQLKSFTQEGMLLPNSEKVTYGLVMYWAPTDHDNDYNMKNGEAPLAIDFGVILNATQVEHEFDSFDNTYDANAKLPEGVAMTPVSVGTDGTVQAPVTATAPNAKVEVPVGTKVAPNTNELKIVLTPTQAPAGITTNPGETVDAVDIHVDGLDAANTELIKVTMNRNPGMAGYKLYHNNVLMTRLNEMPTVANDNEYYYDATTGVVTLWTKNFSPFTEVVVKADTAWYVGHESDTTYTINNASELYGLATVINGGANFTDKTVLIGADIDMASIDNWVGMGLRTGTNGWTTMPNIDGQNHKIMNLKMNGGRPCGFIAQTLSNITIKNLTFENADVTTATSYCGVVIGYQYGHVTLDNVKVLGGQVVSKSKWGTGIGGLVGYSCQNDSSTLIVNNCTVDGLTTRGIHSTGAIVGMTKYAGADRLTVNNCTVQNMNMEYYGSNVGAFILGSGTNGYAEASFTGNGVTTQSNNTITKIA